MNRFQKLLAWIGARSWLTLSAALIVVLGAWGFVFLAGEVMEGSTKNYDERIIQAIDHHRGPPWLEEAGRDITALGSVAVLSLVTFAVIGYLLIRAKYGAMILVIVATLGGVAIGSVLKHSFRRERPNVQLRRDQVFTTSFPSGHSMLSAVVYLTLGSLLARIERHRVTKFYLLAVAVVLTFLVGVSRVYMAVHWPTDVLAGWTAGLVWALICWLVARYLQKHGAVEKG